MEREVKAYIKTCEICQKSKGEFIHPPGLLEPLFIPEQVWEDLSMDFIEGPPASKGYTTFLVVVDRFSKYAHFIPIKHPITALHLAQIFQENIFKLYGILKSITSDGDRLFLSEFWKGICQLQETHLQFSSLYHLQTDGHTERVTSVWNHM